MQRASNPLPFQKIHAFIQQAGGFLKKGGRNLLTIKEPYHGIYYISGRVLFDTQVVVTGRLDKGSHSSLKILSRKAREEDIRAFMEESSGLENPGDRHNADAVLQVSVSANKELYRKIRRRNSVMCEALRELMNDEIEEEKRKAVEDATKELKKAVAKELEEAAQKAEEATQKAEEAHIKSLMENMKWTAEKAMAALNIPVAERADYAARL